MTDIGSTFRALHQPGRPFILANVWDTGTARLMAGLGARALATSSAAHAFALGRGDGGTITRDEALSHAADIVAATPLPVQGDFENGFGNDPDTCAATVRLAAEVGLAGICIEDTALPAFAPYPFDLAVERIRAAAAAARALRRDFVLTARADGVMLGTYDMAEATRRLIAMRDAGADCLYAPLVPDLAQVAALCRAVSAPVNVLLYGPMTAHSLTDFAAAGVARLSFGSSLARITHRVMHEAGLAAFGQGDFRTLGAGISGDLIGALVDKGASQA
jgi:2-methylisocitrate lyase-like PEP mutase family enzyme